mmetsp:Transcript_57414/g.135125  ORF Transcript_57414/g.135125 Transcript_57414/m.135125 type:complete len:126 (+) Transcript_57414:69-446(+)
MSVHVSSQERPVLSKEEKRRIAEALRRHFPDPCEGRELVHCGFNQVVRRLRKGELGSVIASQDANPASLLYDVRTMCLNFNVPFLATGESSASLGQVFGMRSAIAVGVKKEHPKLQQVVTSLQTA